MSKEKKIDDADLVEINGAGAELDEAKLREGPPDIPPYGPPSKGNTADDGVRHGEDDGGLSDPNLR